MVRPSMIENFSLSFQYPEYTRKKNDKVMNVGDLFIPEGTKIQWELITINSDSVYFYKDETIAMERSERNPDVFHLNKVFFQSGNYSFISSNIENQTKDSLAYHINVIPDQFPGITVEE